MELVLNIIAIISSLIAFSFLGIQFFKQYFKSYFLYLLVLDILAAMVGILSIATLALQIHLGKPYFTSIILIMLYGGYSIFVTIFHLPEANHKTKIED